MTGGTGVEPGNLLDTLDGYQPRIIKGSPTGCFMKLCDQRDSRCQRHRRENPPKVRRFRGKAYGNYDIPGRSADVTVIYSLARNSAFTIVADERQAACRQDVSDSIGTWIGPDGELKGN
ncbi:hypothetical protein VSR68_01460 [Paraburkholderia phymatum]|uniref:hypothetical protein n=1 Tax=Paraburkholderia phymatum TaxID=148447 RepID=UPI0031787051